MTSRPRERPVSSDVTKHAAANRAAELSPWPGPGSTAYPARPRPAGRRWWIALAVVVLLCAAFLLIEFWVLQQPALAPLPLPEAD